MDYNEPTREITQEEKIRAELNEYSNQRLIDILVPMVLDEEERCQTIANLEKHVEKLNHAFSDVEDRANNLQILLDKKTAELDETKTTLLNVLLDYRVLAKENKNYMEQWV